MTEHADAVVIGAGVIGAAVALELGRLGYRTLSIDRQGAPGHGSTSDSASIVRVYSATREMALLAWETIPVWQDWAGYLDGPGTLEGAGTTGEVALCRYVRTGSLVIEGHRGGLDQMLPVMAGLAMEHELWDAEAMEQHLGSFDLRSFGPPVPVDDDRFWEEPDGRLRRALYVPEGGYVIDAGLAAQNLAAAAVAAGGRFRYRSDVISVDQAGGRVTGVTLADGTVVESPVVVNVAGPHSAWINRLARVTEGMRITTRPLRHELHVVDGPPGKLGGGTELCVSDGDLAVNFRPEPGGHILVGSEDPDCDPVHWAEDPDDFERTPTVVQWERQILRLARRIPALTVPGRPRGLAGLYDVSDDWMPIYDRADLDGFYMAIGSSGNQFKAAPTAGYLMSRLVDACEAGYDHDAVPLRVTLPHRGLELDLGAFSRRRQPRTDAGFI